MGKSTCLERREKIHGLAEVGDVPLDYDNSFSFFLASPKQKGIGIAIAFLVSLACDQIPRTSVYTDYSW